MFPFSSLFPLASRSRKIVDRLPRAPRQRDSRSPLLTDGPILRQDIREKHSPAPFHPLMIASILKVVEKSYAKVVNTFIKLNFRFLPFFLFALVYSLCLENEIILIGKKRERESEKNKEERKRDELNFRVCENCSYNYKYYKNYNKNFYRI